MARIVKSIEIDAPREHVFALAADVFKQPEWTTFVKEVLITSGDGKSAGTTDRITIKVGPRSTKSDGLWTEYQPGEAFARQSTSGMPMAQRMRFEPAGNGARVEWVMEYTPPLGLVGRFVDVAFMNRVFQNELEASLENLKSALES